MQLGINLGEAVMDKFNRVSERVGSTIRIAADGWHSDWHRIDRAEVR
jgi:hypothetical protein